MVLIQRRSLDRWLLQTIDGCLAGVIFLVPLLMGGRHAIGQLALTILAVAAALACGVRWWLDGDGRWCPIGAMALIWAGLMLLALQLIPLPSSWIALLSPHMAGVLPLWSASASPPAAMGAWPCLSLAPAETVTGLVLFLDYAILFVVTVHRLRYIEDVERLLRWCAISAAAMAALGIVQLVTSNGKFLWFYEHPMSTTSQVAQGCFTNRNHFANFLALGLGPLVWWLQDELRRGSSKTGRTGSLAVSRDSERDDRRVYLLAIALGIVLFAGALSLSRGGIVTMLLAAAIGATTCYATGRLGGRFFTVLGAAVAIIGISLAIFGWDRVTDRLSDLTAGSVKQLDQADWRRDIWSATVQAAPDYALLGAGVGAFREVYPMYTETLPDEGVEFTHAECCYLQRLLETGIPGLCLSLFGIGLGTFWCVSAMTASNATRVRVCAGAIAASLAATVAHGAVDFVWYVPACMASVLIQVACVSQVRWLPSRTCGHARASSRAAVASPCVAIPRASFFPTYALRFVTVVAIAVGGGWMIYSRVGPAVAQPYWERYQRVRLLVEKETPATLGAAGADVAVQKQWIAWLEAAVRWEPTHIRAHLALAETYRRLFDRLQSDGPNPMSLTNVRDAAIQSQFASRDALAEWLTRAVGAHWTHLDRSLYHARQAVRLCPFEGRAYLYLADLLFLNGGNMATKQACLDQALRVRPHDGAVLNALANEALLAGDFPQWLRYAKEAFRTGRRQQMKMIEDLMNGTPTEHLPSVVDLVIREFQPDLIGVQHLERLYAARCPNQPHTGLTRCLAERSEYEAITFKTPKSGWHFYMASYYYNKLHDDARALQCLEKALEQDPDSYDIHEGAGTFYLARKRYTEAETHFRWCLQRMPRKPSLEAGLREALKERLDAQRRAAAEPANPMTR